MCESRSLPASSCPIRAIAGTWSIPNCSARCGNKLGSPVGADDRCARCGVAVHSCINCVSFDTGSRWECSQPALTARVSPKDERNSCTFFDPRTTVERQTSTQVAPNTARQAFDDLFKN